MDIKKIANLLLNFATKRLAEIFGIIVFASGTLLLISLITYSPEDPNFIFPENTEIKNFLGFQGSFISDLLFQSVGLISYLIPLTFALTGINIFRLKEFFLLIENIFFTIIYCVFGTLFFSFFYTDAFTFYINGNGGFVGTFLNQTYLKQILLINSQLFYYFLITLILILFLKSINFNLFKCYEIILKSLILFKSKEKKNYTDKRIRGFKDSGICRKLHIRISTDTEKHFIEEHGLDPFNLKFSGPFDLDDAFMIENLAREANDLQEMLSDNEDLETLSLDEIHSHYLRTKISVLREKKVIEAKPIASNERGDDDEIPF